MYIDIESNEYKEIISMHVRVLKFTSGKIFINTFIEAKLLFKLDMIHVIDSLTLDVTFS